MSRTYLLDLTLASQMPLAREIGQRLRRAGIVPAFSYSGSVPETGSAITEMAISISAAFFNFDVLAEAESSRWNRRKKFMQTLRVWLGSDPEEHLFARDFRRNIRAAETLLARCRPDAVITCEDGISSNSALIARAGKRGIPVVVCPYEVSEQEDFDNYVEQKYREGALKLLPDNRTGERLRKRYPQWVRPTRYGEVIMFPPGYIFARKRLGLTLQNPWTVHGGPADLIAVESEAMMEIYRREGIAPEKLRLLGSPYCDAMADVLNESPAERMASEKGDKIRAGRTSVLISLPPSYHDTWTGANEFPRYEDLWRAIAALAERHGDIDFTVTLHPGMDAGHEAFVRKLGFRISDEWILRLIPKHDLFFTCFSSTIRWAIAAGKPVINYDAYGFQLSLYEGVRGVLTTSTFEQAAAHLERLKNDANYRSFASELNENRLRWGRLDGRNTERIIQAIEDLSVEFRTRSVRWFN